MNWLALCITIGKWLRKYAVLTIILATFTTEIVSTLQFGMGPKPQLPPNGYVAERGLVTLQWNRGNREKPITLQVSRTKDFEELLYDKEVSGITHNYRENLERGQDYYWRLVQDDEYSDVSRFTISPQHVNL